MHEDIDPGAARKIADDRYVDNVKTGGSEKLVVLSDARLLSALEKVTLIQLTKLEGLHLALFGTPPLMSFLSIYASVTIY